MTKGLLSQAEHELQESKQVLMATLRAAANRHCYTDRMPPLVDTIISKREGGEGAKDTGCT